MRYVVISPMKNEEKYVRHTLDSMIAQTVPPAEWIVVNDGSIDASPAIVREYVNRVSWIRLVSVEGLGERLPEHYGGHVVHLFLHGLTHVNEKEYDFAVKLDCDISFEPEFFHKVIEELQRNPRLGITSGLSFTVQDGKLVREETAEGHTLGATKVYRSKCFREIGGLVSAMGWDGIDEIKARMKGWEARPVRELKFVHHRPEGMASGLYASGVERGKGSYFMGYHPLFMLLRALYRMARPGFLADGIGLLAGYFGCVWRREEKIPDVEFIKFVQRNQLRKLLLRKSEV
jgi:poly-beta-1,6-N-acetyl-D-glucosamine synthase